MVYTSSHNPFESGGYADQGDSTSIEVPVVRSGGRLRQRIGFGALALTGCVAATAAIVVTIGGESTSPTGDKHTFEHVPVATGEISSVVVTPEYVPDTKLILESVGMEPRGGQLPGGRQLWVGENDNDSDATVFVVQDNEVVEMQRQDGRLRCSVPAINRDNPAGNIPVFEALKDAYNGMQQGKNAGVVSSFGVAVAGLEVTCLKDSVMPLGRRNNVQ